MTDRLSAKKGSSERTEPLSQPRNNAVSVGTSGGRLSEPGGSRQTFCELRKLVVYLGIVAALASLRHFRILAWMLLQG